MPEEKAVAEEPEASPKGGTSIVKILLIIGLALVSSAGGGVISFMLLSKTLGTKAKAAEKPENINRPLHFAAALGESFAFFTREQFGQFRFPRFE